MNECLTASVKAAWDRDKADMTARVAKFLCVMMLGAAAVHLVGQSADTSATRSRILALEHAWNQAEAFKDLKALDALFDNGLVYVDADGTLMTKAEFLSQVKSEHVQQIITELMTVQVFDNTAIVNGIYRSAEFKNGKPLTRRGRFIDTWVYKNSTWVCVAAQATPVVR
jgi:hypothetical protein